MVCVFNEHGMYIYIIYRTREDKKSFGDKVIFLILGGITMSVINVTKFDLCCEGSVWAVFENVSFIDTDWKLGL